MLQLESMRVVNATLKRIKTELEEGNVEDPEELSKLAKEDLKRQESEVQHD